MTLAATLHCAWSSKRYVGQKGVAPQNCAGGIPGSRVQNAIWPLLLKMEAMTKDEKEEGIATAAIDSVKYFDSICWEVTFQMLDRMGLDQRIWKPMLNFIAHLDRFNKVAGTLGPTWTCTNSIIQGYSLSLLAISALCWRCWAKDTGQIRYKFGCTLTTLKTMLRSNGTWIPVWRQAWEAMQKRIVRPGAEGLAANVDRVLRRIGWTWENALEVKTEEGERMHITQCPEGYWKQWRLRQAANRKTAQDLEKIDIQASQLKNVETMHPAYRDMMLAQKDAQLLDWERNNRTYEIAAVAAAEKLRSRVEDARDRDDGSKMSAAKAAEELGGYLCEGRSQVWTDGSCLDPRWEAIAKAGAGGYFSKDSKSNVHFSIKARTGKTSVRGELEAATCIRL